MRIGILILAAMAAFGQEKPPYDVSDPDGAVAYPNGKGRYLWTRKGIWRTGALQGYGGRATAAELQAVTGTLNQLTAILQATPTGTGLVGFFMKESRGYLGTEQALEFETGFFPFYLVDDLVNGKYVPVFGGETESVYWHFNRLPGKLGRAVVGREKAAGRDTEFYLRPEVTGTYAGFPVYEKQDLVIARAGREPWAAVAVGRLLRAVMAELEKDRATAESRLAGLKKQNEETQSAGYEEKMRAHLEKNSGSFRVSNPAKWQGRVEGMERELKYNRELAAKRANPQRDKEGAWYWNPVDALAAAQKQLAGLTAEEAGRPACYVAAEDRDGRYAMQGRVEAVGSGAKCVPVVMDNGGYFDAKLGRAAAQILVVRSVGRCAEVVNGKLVQKGRPRREVPPQGCLKHVPMWEEMDWGKVAGLVAR